MGTLEIVDLRDQLPWHPDRPKWPGRRSIDSIDKVILHQSLGHGAAFAESEYLRSAF